MTAIKDDYYHVGLTDEQVRKSRDEHGVNLLTPPKRPSLWKLYLEKFEDPVVRVLLVAALFSLIISIVENEYAETIGIIVAILLATGIGFFFEYDAGKKFDLLNAVNEETLVKVIRNGHVQEIPRKDVVVGDIVVLETGEEVPADGELLEAISLQVNESNLTGEPVVTKTTVEADFDEEATYASNRILRGTTVVDGHGTMRVEAVGDATEIGKVARQSTEQNTEPTPLNIQLTKLANLIGKIGLSVAGLAFLIFFVKDVVLVYDFSSFHTFRDWLPALQATLQYFMMAVTLIVVAVPEGLPMSVTLSLALNMRRMLSTNNLVRKMHACETMGAVSVICTDKTGTLTQNQMQVAQTDFWALEDKSFPGSELGNLIREGIAVNSTAFLDMTDGQKPKVIGNPTEGALLLWLKSQGENYLELRESASVVDQLTFSTERKYMATVVDSPLIGKKVLYVKGAPEIVLSESNWVLTEKGILPASEYKTAVDEQLLAYQSQAMRTLGFAYQILDDDKPCFSEGRLSDVDLTFIGIVAISDPVREDVPDAIRSCLDAGVNVKIVTGDTPGTAREIGRQIGLWLPSDTDRNLMTGVEFAATSDEELLQRLPDIKIISRARPMDKERLVRLLQKLGYVVAVTGDGTNDAPALNAAQVGLSMGDGTTVAKEASSITILDNSFRSITRAVMWGRSLYQNIQRFLLFQMTVNVVACLIVLIGAFLGTQSPLTVTQMLWVNLIMDTFAAMALASLPPDERVMKDKPRRQTDFIITRSMAIDIVGIGSFFVLVLFGLLQYFKYEEITALSQFDVQLFFSNYFRFENIPDALSAYELTIFFTVFVMFQFWNMFNAKAFATNGSALNRMLQCRSFLGVAAIILLGQIVIVTIGGPMFGVTPLSVQDWIYIIAATSFILWLGELYRLVKKLFKVKY